MTSWFLFLLCHGLICTVFMALGMSIEKNPNSPLANALGFKSKLAKSNSTSWTYAQRLYGSLLKNGGAGLLITCFICMLCVLGQTELVISIAGGVLFGLEVAFYLGVHWYCQSKLKASSNGVETSLDEPSLPLEKQTKKQARQKMKQEKREAKLAKKASKDLQEVESQEPVSSQSLDPLEENLDPVPESQEVKQEVQEEKLDATRRLIFDPVPTLVRSNPVTLSRANKHQALAVAQEEKDVGDETKVIARLDEATPLTSSMEKSRPSANYQLDSLNSSQDSIETLVLDYKIQQVGSKPLKVQDETQVGPSFHVLNGVQEEQELLEKTTVFEPSQEPRVQSFEEEDLEEGIVSQQFFRHPIGRVPKPKEEFIADTVIFHDPQEPQPIYHRATTQTKDSVEIPSEFFEPQPDRTNCPLKRSKKAKGSSNPIPPDPESAFRYRRLAASLRGEALSKD